MMRDKVDGCVTGVLSVLAIIGVIVGAACLVYVSWLAYHQRFPQADFWTWFF